MAVGERMAEIDVAVRRPVEGVEKWLPAELAHGVGVARLHDVYYRRMPSFEFRFWEDRLSPGVVTAALRPANRIVYVVEGDATVGPHTLTTNSACHVAGAL